LRLRKGFSVLALVLLGVLFAAGNLWFSAVRSTIPLQLNGRATHKEHRLEKTPGVDDVFLITFDNDHRIQVDAPIYEAIELNRLVRKDAWSRKLEIDGKFIDVDWSTDYYRMLWAMPLVVLLFIVLAILALMNRSSSNAD